jgi:hypothetical protein
MPDFATYPMRARQADPQDRRAFQALLVEGMDELGLTELDLCERFPVNVASVVRWREGVSAPRPRIRVKVLEHLAGLAATPVYAQALAS